MRVARSSRPMKPPGVLKPNGHPALHGLDTYLYTVAGQTGGANANVMRCALTGRFAPNRETWASSSLAWTKFGLANNASRQPAIDTRNSDSHNTEGPFWFLWAGKLQTLPAADVALFSREAGLVGMQVRAGTDGSAIRANWGNTSIDTDTGVLEADKHHVILLKYNAVWNATPDLEDATFFVDGVRRPLSTEITSGTDYTGGAGQLRAGSYGGTDSTRAWTALCACWTLHPVNLEPFVRDISIDPWCMFRPRRVLIGYTPAAGDTDELTGQDMTSGTPTLESPTIGQEHTLTGQDVTSGTPTLETPTVGQEHALTGQDVTSGAPTLETPTVGQEHALTGQDIASGTPTLETPSIEPEHAFERGEYAHLLKNRQEPNLKNRRNRG